MPKSYIPGEYHANEAYIPQWGSRTLCAVDAVCSDGIVRRAALTKPGEPDTWFSATATVHVNKTTVTGFITADDTYGDPDATVVYRFYAYKYLKNCGLLPPSTFTH